jgi:multicomponent Na+:H+ antiporter subunit C
MPIVMALCIGLMTAAAVYLFLSRQAIRIVLGFVLLGNAVNLAILVVGRLTPGTPPLIAPTEMVLKASAANSLPQALILTAIVIGFGLLAFVLALACRLHAMGGSLDAASMPQDDSDAVIPGDER